MKPIRFGMLNRTCVSVLALGRNMTDERTYHEFFGQPLGAGRLNSYPTEPATYGISFTRSWD